MGTQQRCTHCNPDAGTPPVHPHIPAEVGTCTVCAEIGNAVDNERHRAVAWLKHYSQTLPSSVSPSVAVYSASCSIDVGRHLEDAVDETFTSEKTNVSSHRTECASSNDAADETVNLGSSVTEREAILTWLTHRAPTVASYLTADIAAGKHWETVEKLKVVSDMRYDWVKVGREEERTQIVAFLREHYPDTPQAADDVESGEQWYAIDTQEDHTRCGDVPGFDCWCSHIAGHEGAHLCTCDEPPHTFGVDTADGDHGGREGNTDE